MATYNDSHLLDINRVGKITASVAAAIMGIDPYTSRQKAWRRITGNETEAEKRPSDNPNIIRGVENEWKALESFEVQSGLLLLPGRFVLHPEIAFLGASPDSITYKGKRPVEVKCPAALHSDIPAHYNVQVQVQIQCLNADYGWFFSWTEEEPNGFIKKVDRDDKYFWDTIYPALHSFYFDYVEKNIPPPRKWSKQ